MRSDLVPLPRRVQWWRSTADRRRSAWVSLQSVARSLLTIAITVLGGTLISFGVYSVYRPAGFVVAGLICWLLLWSHEQDKRRNE